VREKDHVKSVWLQLKAKGLKDVPPYEDSLFVAFAERHGFSTYSPQRQARIDAILAAYADKATWIDNPLATVYNFPIEPVAMVVDLREERIRRRGNQIEKA
jgi:hypothetical protein